MATVGDKVRRSDDKARYGWVLGFEVCPDFYDGISVFTVEGGNELWRLEDCEFEMEFYDIR